MQNLEFIFIITGVLLLIAAAYLGRRRKVDPNPRAPAQPQPGLSPENTQKLQTSLIELLRELHALSNDMTVDLEEKLSELKEVLQEADKKLEEASNAEIEEEPAAAPAPAPQDETAESPEGSDSEFPETAADDIASPPTGRYGEIYRMTDEGLPIDEIARRMNMGKGEIQLILSLREED